MASSGTGPGGTEGEDPPAAGQPPDSPESPAPGPPIEGPTPSQPQGGQAPWGPPPGAPPLSDGGPLVSGLHTVDRDAAQEAEEQGPERDEAEHADGRVDRTTKHVCLLPACHDRGHVSNIEGSLRCKGVTAVCHRMARAGVAPQTGQEPR